MAAITAQHIVDAGTNVTYAAITASDTYPIGNGKNSFVHFKNTTANPITITVTGQGTESYGVARPNSVLSLVITTGELLVPLRKEYDNGTGSAVITATGTLAAGVTSALVVADWAS